MDDLPELPFEQVLSYLSIEDRLKARAVSRRWYHKINCFKVKSLCYSSGPSGFIFGKSRWLSGAFAENFISSTRFTSFFDTFGQTVLSTLKSLRLCDLDLREGDQAAFARILNSFGQLKELDIIRARFNQSNLQFKLSLPMLTSLQLEDVEGIQKLTLEAPRLRKVKILNGYRTDLRVEIVHGESVKRLLVDWLGHTEVKNLKNLQYLHAFFSLADSTFLSSLQQLKEIHTNESENVPELLEQKQRYGRADLKIYLRGLLLNGPDDPAIYALNGTFPECLSGEWLACLAENPSRLADEIPFYRYVLYPHIQGHVAPGLEVDLLKRFTDLNKVTVGLPVQEIQRFLDLLKNCMNIVELVFHGNHPQDLFDRLPEHCAVQKLDMFIERPPSDLAFLFRLKHLIHLNMYWSIDTQTVRRAFEVLPAISKFEFGFGHEMASIKICQSKQFQVWIARKGETTVSDLNAAIEFIFGSKRLMKRTREVLHRQVKSIRPSI